MSEASAGDLCKGVGCFGFVILLWQLLVQHISLYDMCAALRQLWGRCVLDLILTGVSKGV